MNCIINAIYNSDDITVG